MSTMKSFAKSLAIVAMTSPPLAAAERTFVEMLDIFSIDQAGDLVAITVVENLDSTFAFVRIGTPNQDISCTGLFPKNRNILLVTPNAEKATALFDKIFNEPEWECQPFPLQEAEHVEVECDAVEGSIVKEKISTELPDGTKTRRASASAQVECTVTANGAIFLPTPGSPGSISHTRELLIGPRD